MSRICIVTTSEMTMRAFLVDQVRAHAREHEVTLVTAFVDQAFWRAIDPSIRLVDMPLARRVAPWRDLTGLLRLVRLFRRARFDLVHSMSPKAGLLAAIAGFVTRVPRRLHTFTGQVWVVRRGASRWLLRALDRLMAALLTHPLVDSPSQRAFLRAEGVLGASEGIVLGDGSVSGVDTVRFRADAVMRATVRGELDIPDSALVFLFLGRVTLDKGVVVLAEAFRRLHAEFPHARLVIVGPDEEGLGDRMRAALGPAVEASHFVGHTDAPERWMTAADVFCLPSRREGFGTVLVEAAAAGLPVIATRIYGITDAVEEGRGARLVPVDDATALHEAMRWLAAEPVRRTTMGASARDRAIRLFSQERITGEVVALYARLLSAAP